MLICGPGPFAPVEELERFLAELESIPPCAERTEAMKSARESLAIAREMAASRAASRND